MLWLLLWACAGPAKDAEGTDDADLSEGTGDTEGTEGTDEPCAPEGTVDCPIRVDDFPYEDARTTALAPQADWDAYSCAPDTDEAGPEWIYAVEVPGEGALTVSVTDGSGVDVDVQILAAADPDRCLSRDNTDAAWIVEATTVWVVVDTWVNGEGVPQEGDYDLIIDWVPLPTGDCAFEPEDLRMYWEGCAPGIDCTVQGGDVLLHTPSLGPVVGEAHLVTTEDDFGGEWPVSFTDGIEDHYALSEEATGYEMDRSEPWAPSGEGGSSFGQGSTGNPVPALDEAWYVNMYWRDKPAKGTRMLVWNPFTGAMVVASGGYETGPGSNTAIGGAVEEIHHALGTSHRDNLVMGFAADPDLPLGPISCP